MTLMAVAHLDDEQNTPIRAPVVPVLTANCRASFPWFALQVRTRNEAGVAEQLGGQGYERFLPLYKVRKRWSDRIKEVDAPLFPGYLFCRFNPQDRLPILKTPGVMQIVGFKNGPVAVDESEIQALQTDRRSGRTATALAVFDGWRSRKN